MDVEITVTKPRITVADIKTGETFLWSDKCYLLTDEHDSVNKRRVCVNLMSGVISRFGEDVEVFPIRLKVVNSEEVTEE